MNVHLSYVCIVCIMYARTCTRQNNHLTSGAIIFHLQSLIKHIYNGISIKLYRYCTALVNSSKMIKSHGKIFSKQNMHHRIFRQQNNQKCSTIKNSFLVDPLLSHPLPTGYYNSLSPQPNRTKPNQTKPNHIKCSTLYSFRFAIFCFALF